MLVAVQGLVKYVIVLYLVTHGLPIAGEIELPDLLSALGLESSGPAPNRRIVRRGDPVRREGRPPSA